MNEQIKTLIAEKGTLYKRLKRRMLNSKLLDKFDALQAKLQSSINFFQFEYYRKISKKLYEPSTSPKCYWILLKTLLNGRKIPCVPPLYHDNKFITDFKEKSGISNSFFAKQCSLIVNGSTLPSLFPLTAEKPLSDFDVSAEDIKNIISKLDSNKAHGDDMIIIRMLKLCDESICKPLSIILKSCLTQYIFPSEWKKANVVPIHKKNDKQCVKNYRPVCFLPICSKVLERIIYNTMFTYFIENNLISKNQSGFKPSDSCVNQLLVITHKMFSGFDGNYDVRGVFLDISNPRHFKSFR